MVQVPGDYITRNRAPIDVIITYRGKCEIKILIGRWSDKAPAGIDAVTNSDRVTRGSPPFAEGVSGSPRVTDFHAR